MRIHPWLLAVLGLTAFGLLVWFAGPLASIGNSAPLASDDARIALIAAFALQYLVHKGWSAWSARRRNERVVDQLAPAASGAEPAELAQLRRRFSAALATLRRTRFGSRGGYWSSLSWKFGRQYLYQLPWYLIIVCPRRREDHGAAELRPEVSARRRIRARLHQGRWRHAKLRLVVHRPSGAAGHGWALHDARGRSRGRPPGVGGLPRPVEARAGRGSR